MSDKTILKQPVLGIIATAICIIASLALCGLFDAFTFGTWVTLLLVAMVPGQIVLGLVWQTNYPGFLSRLAQPAKGLALLAMMIVSGLIVAPVAIYFIGGGLTPPTPYVLMFIIFSVVVTFWLVIIMQCWPLTAMSQKQGPTGIGIWLLSYLLTYVLFKMFFNYAFLSTTPLYLEALDPKGLFNAWFALSYALTALVMMLTLVLLDFWPVEYATKRIKILAKQPFFGLINTLIVLVASYLMWHYFVIGRGIDPVVYMARVPASIIFGQFIMLIMMQTAPVQTLAQPFKGIVLTSSAIGLSVILYALYSWVSHFVVGPLTGGTPGYQLDLWLASAMLAVTFPMLVFFAEFLGFWPLVAQTEPQPNELADSDISPQKQSVEQ